MSIDFERNTSLATDGYFPQQKRGGVAEDILKVTAIIL
jgi:hypothetical protein